MNNMATRQCGRQKNVAHPAWLKYQIEKKEMPNISIESV